MRLALIPAALGISLALAGFLALSPLSGASAATTDVEVDDFYFCSAQFEDGVCVTNVTAGDTVTWHVEGGIHTVSGSGFDSGTMNAGDDFSHTFATAGTFDYMCQVHPDQMNGQIVVAAQATPTPAPTTAPGGTATTAAGSPTATGAALPRTGGAPADGGSLDTLALALLAAAGGFALASSALVAVHIRRR